MILAAFFEQLFARLESANSIAKVFGHGIT
jgi:hypothetical protein